MSRPAQRLRTDANPQDGSKNDPRVDSSEQLTPRATLTILPLELLAEVLLQTQSPPTVLAVSRTSSYLYRTLVLSPAASFIWRGVRKTCKPRPLPDPSEGWVGSEADYAAFVFDGGVCEVCKRRTKAMYVSFAARIRLCGSHHCRKKFIAESLIDVTSKFLGQARGLIWVPYVESTRCFSPMSIIYSNWPENTTVLLRKSHWADLQRAHQAYTAAEAQAQAKRSAASTSGDSGSATGAGTDHSASEKEEGEIRDAFLEKCHAKIERFPKIMTLAVELLQWKQAYEERHRSFKVQNESWAKALARQEGWNLQDLLNSQAYGSLHRNKTYLMENVEASDISPIRHEIESQLLSIQARRDRQRAEAGYRQRMSDVETIYWGMRSGTFPGASAGPSESSSADGKMVLPPLASFHALPSVSALKGRPDPTSIPAAKNSVTADLKSSPLATSLITSDIHAWLIPVRKYLLGLLGFPGEWRSASTLKVAPLERVTARFLCGRCGDSGVSSRYQREGCLDFRGVCSHVCKAAKGKNVGKQRETHEHDSATGAPSGDDQRGREAGEVRKGNTRKKRKKGRNLDWKVEVFQKDVKAIALIDHILSLLNLSDEDSRTSTELESLGGRIRCTSCTGWIVMDFASAIGHSHRHESMQIQLLPTADPPPLAAPQPGRNLASTSTTHPELAFDHGLAERLLELSNRARKLRDVVNYGCKHCLVVDECNVVEGLQDEAVKGRKKGSNPGARAMNMNALRSHAKAKHGIEHIRDEDIFCCSPVQWEAEEEKDNRSKGGITDSPILDWLALL
ncbi:hypothetical protein HYDPIDRAFT_159175 [Hydnomerulius pinastri MD-312]|uniref:F-box domain-containing protein n=1 Tax=Hydnomerulius pinastri MD-312 TaxID=994086 RepID=A0A0C9W4T8_9AGAM|nr:hypothetical protein HYDPIDRAFT_159175 [Hydnomerulius pinastri MD-312]